MAKKRKTVYADVAVAAVSGMAFGAAEGLVNREIAKRPLSKITPEMVSGGMAIVAGTVAVFAKPGTLLLSGALGALGASMGNLGGDIVDRVVSPSGGQSEEMPSGGIAAGLPMRNMAHGEATPAPNMPSTARMPVSTPEVTPRGGVEVARMPVEMSPVLQTQTRQPLPVKPTVSQRPSRYTRMALTELQNERNM